MTPAKIATLIASIRARADAATPGPWDCEWSDQTIEVNAGTALTRWNDAGTVGTPASRWTSTDRILDFDIDSLEEDEEQVRGLDAEFIAHAREDVPTLLGLIGTLIADLAKAEARRDLAEQTIADAPHDWEHCGLFDRAGYRYVQPAKCTCWKAEYDAAKEATNE